MMRLLSTILIPFLLLPDMNYDINEKETSIDNMGDSLLIAIEECVNRGNKGDADAIMSEWIVDGRDPIDGSYEFIFIPNFTLQ